MYNRVMAVVEFHNDAAEVRFLHLKKRISSFLVRPLDRELSKNGFFQFLVLTLKY